MKKTTQPTLRVLMMGAPAFVVPVPRKAGWLLEAARFGYAFRAGPVAVTLDMRQLDELDAPRRARKGAKP